MLGDKFKQDKILDVRKIVPSLEPLRGRIESISAKKPWCTVSHIMVTSLRSKWAVGAIRRGTFRRVFATRGAGSNCVFFEKK